MGSNRWMLPIGALVTRREPQSSRRWVAAAVLSMVLLGLVIGLALLFGAFNRGALSDPAQQTSRPWNELEEET